jgi:hypothetical protein
MIFVCFGSKKIMIVNVVSLTHKNVMICVCFGCKKTTIVVCFGRKKIMTMIALSQREGMTVTCFGYKRSLRRLKEKTNPQLDREKGQEEAIRHACRRCLDEPIQQEARPEPKFS